MKKKLSKLISLFIKKITKAITYALNPTLALHNEKKQKWYLFLFMPACGWMFFFHQVYLDKGYTPLNTLLGMSFIGFVTGYVVVLSIGFLITGILKLLKRKVRYDNVIACIALSHTYMFFSLILGYVYRLLGMNSSATFGIAGLLCTLMPIYSGIRSLDNKKPFLPPLLASLVGILMLCCWRLIIVIY